MTADEFVRICQLCGYASKKNATRYAARKTVLTAEDFEMVHRLNERQNDVKNGVLVHARQCNLTGSQLLDKLAERPSPWNHTFDASRG